MQTDYTSDLFRFEPVEGRPVMTAFDGGSITSDAGALLVGATDRAIGLMDRFGWSDDEPSSPWRRDFPPNSSGAKLRRWNMTIAA